jgi:hypothetical protein
MRLDHVSGCMVLQFDGLNKGWSGYGTHGRILTSRLDLSRAAPIAACEAWLAQQQKPKPVTHPSADSVWTCSNGGPVSVPAGGDGPMREAVRRGFVDLFGSQPRAIFSGWGDRWSGVRVAMIENRAPTAAECATACPDCAAKDAQLMAAEAVLREEGRVNEALRCRNATAPGAADAWEARERERKAVLANVAAQVKAKNAEIFRLNAECRAHVEDIATLSRKVDALTGDIADRRRECGSYARLSHDETTRANGWRRWAWMWGVLWAVAAVAFAARVLTEVSQ